MNPFIRAYCPGNKLDKGFKACYNYDKISPLFLRGSKGVREQ